MSRVVASGHVVDEGFLDDGSIEKRDWPWLVPVELEASRDLISQGFSLDLLDVDRPLRRSVRRQSHIVLHPPEFEQARRLFGVG